MVKTSMNCMLPQCAAGRLNRQPAEMPAHLGSENAGAVTGVTQLFLITYVPSGQTFCDLVVNDLNRCAVETVKKEELKR